MNGFWWGGRRLDSMENELQNCCLIFKTGVSELLNWVCNIFTCSWTIACDRLLAFQTTHLKGPRHWVGDCDLFFTVCQGFMNCICSSKDLTSAWVLADPLVLALGWWSHYHCLYALGCTRNVIFLGFSAGRYKKSLVGHILTTCEERHLIWDFQEALRYVLVE